MKSLIKLIIFPVLLLLLFNTAAVAQKPEDTISDDEYFPYLENDRDMKFIKPKRSFAAKGIQYGGWITPVLIYQKNDERALFVSMTTARLWAKTYLWSNSYLYVRGKDVFFKTITDKGYTIDQTNNLIDLDLGYLSASNDRGSMQFFLGRKYFKLGSGIILNGRGDGAEFRFFSRYINFKIIGMYTGLMRKDNNPYRLSDKDISEGTKRVFTGGLLSNTFSNQTFYLFGLAQIDLGEEDPGRYTRYQSQYYGAGLKGYIFSNLLYSGEFIYERGKSYIAGTGNSEDINAFAGIFDMKYFFDVLMNPALIIQYAYGSGDKDRGDSRAPNGNISGSDRGFIGFGPYMGGYALRPTLSNIHVARGGFSVAPFSDSSKSYIRRFVIISKYSYYMKDAVAGSIKYGEAKESKRFLGQGVDISLRWKIFSDFSFFFNYAIFIPGDAYLSTEDEGKGNLHFILCGLNISF